jgi:hypothetical protein
LQPLSHWKRNKYYILSSVACPTLQYFSTLSRKQHNFQKKKKVIVHKMCILISSTAFVWNISHSKKKWERYYQKCLVVFMQITPYSCPILMQLEFYKQFIKKYSNIKFHKKSSNRACCSLWMEGHDKANSHFSQFCKCA